MTVVGFCESFIQGRNLKKRKALRWSHGGTPVSSKSRLHQLWGWSLSQRRWCDAFASMRANGPGLTRTKARLSIQEKSTSFTKKKKGAKIYGAAFRYSHVPTRKPQPPAPAPGLTRATWHGAAAAFPEETVSSPAPS